MAFKDQVEDLTSLTVSDNDELSQFLKDGVLDVTNRWLSIRPQDIELFGRESSETTSNASLNLNSARIISVIREDGTNNQWRNCRKISPALQYDVTDVDSLNYASKINPAYMIGDAGKISVFPVPGADPNAFKAYYVNKDPVNSSGSALIHSHDDILYFPIDKVYLVVMYTGIKLLQATMGDNVISLTSVPPDTPSLDAISFSAPGVPTTPSDPSFTVTTITEDTVSAGSVASVTVGTGTTMGTSTTVGTSTDVSTVALSGPTIHSNTVPSYADQSLRTGIVSFDTFYEDTSNSNPFGTSSDPGLLSITVVPPDAPTITTISYSAAANSDATATAVSTATASKTTIVDVSSNAPTYTPPTVGNATEELTTSLTALTGDALAADADFLDVSKWFTALGEMIEDEEDTELAQAQIGKISTYIQAYGQAMQNQLNEFNEANVRYQMEFQEAVTKENQDLQVEIANANNLAQEYREEAQQTTQIDQFNKAQDQALSLANAAKAMEDDIADNNSKVQKYSAEIQSYQAEVAEQVQEYTQNLQRYTAELNTTYQAWAKTESDNLQLFQIEIQNELNNFNEANAVYQAALKEEAQNLQVAAGRVQQQAQIEIQEVLKQADIELTEASKQADIELQEVLKQADVDMADAQKEADLNLQASIQNTANDLKVKIENNAKTLEKDIQEYAQELTLFSGEIQKYQSEIQSGVQTMQGTITNNQSLLAKYQAEIAEYQAEVAKETQEQTVKMQQYQLLHNQLKAEYDQAFMIAAPKQQPQGQA